METFINKITEKPNPPEAREETRKLTIQAPNDDLKDESVPDINQRISHLELTIRQLQEEIKLLSDSSIKIDEDIDDDFNEQHEEESSYVFQVNQTRTKEESENDENFSTMKQRISELALISELWQGKKKENEDKIQGMIDDLKAEITEKMESLKKVKDTTEDSDKPV